MKKMTSKAPTPEMLEQAKINALKKISDEKYEEYLKARSELDKAEKEALHIDQYKDKFVKIGSTYMFVKELFKFPKKDGHVYVFRGFGFKGVITNYMDNMYVDIDGYTEEEIYVENLPEYLKRVNILTKEEFFAAYYQLIKELGDFIDKLFYDSETTYFNPET